MMPQTLSPHTAVAGIDVSKDWLDVAIETGPVVRIDNKPAALKRLAARLTRSGVTAIGLEPTGGYERLAVAVLGEAGLTVLKVDSWRCRQFAKACGQRAKSDPLDARMIRSFMLHHPCRPFATPDPAQQALTAWVREIARAEADIRRLENRKQSGKQAGVPQAGAPSGSPHLPAALIDRLDAEIGTLRQTVAEAERQIEILIAADPDRARKAELITSVPGVAHKTTRVLLAEAPELGSLDPRALAALCGLAPYTRQSGKSQAPAHIQAGRKALTRACYLAAFAAIRCNAWAKALYKTMRARAKPAKVALIAIARKLVITLNAMIRDNKSWITPQST